MFSLQSLSLLVQSLAFCICVGCTGVGVTRTKNAPPRPVGSSIDIYYGEAEVKRPYEVVCVIDSHTGSTNFHDRTAANAIEHAKKAAVENGADAIIILSMDTEGFRAYRTAGRGKALMKGIHYTDK